MWKIQEPFIHPFTSLLVLLRFQRSMAMLRVANKRLVELRDSLRKKLSVATHQQKKLRGDQIFETLDEMVLYGPQLKRALLGGMPKLEGGGHG